MNRLFAIFGALFLFSWCFYAQETVDLVAFLPDSAMVSEPTMKPMKALRMDTSFYVSDTLGMHKQALETEVPQTEKHKFQPNPNKSVWLAVICPGLGQIYNRRYWKLPIVYGGFAGCAYAIGWNGKYYNDYINAYRDIMDADPNTNSYLDVLPYGTDPESSYAKSFLNQKQNFYRKYRDLSVIVTVVLYALSVVDAFVDAQLMDFDVSPDLSLNVQPTLIETQNRTLASSAVGMQFKIIF